jgi:hypothetical protein
MSAEVLEVQRTSVLGRWLRGGAGIFNITEMIVKTKSEIL